MDASRYAGMPAPVAYTAPTSDPTMTVRLHGRQRVYRFDSSGAVSRSRFVRFGASSVFATVDQLRTLNGRQYVQIRSGSFAGWWVAAPDASMQLTAYSTPASVRLYSGSQRGVRFYAAGTVRVRKSLELDGAATYTASHKATVGDRSFVLLTSGPLAGRWVSLRRADVVSGGQSVAGDPAPQPTATPVAPQPTATPQPTPTPPPSSTDAPAATWKGVVLLYPGTDVTYTKSNGSEYHMDVDMSNAMHDLVIDTLGKFKRSVGTWSGGLAAMDMDIVEVPHPITSLDRWGSNYWVGPTAVEADIDRYAPTGRYDSIFVVWQARDDREYIPTGGWGLTLPPGSWANGAGYSSIITPSELWWWTNSEAPEEVFVHEWLHQVVYWNEIRDRLQLDLHAGPSYGYQAVNGSWKRWLSDVMQGKVWDIDHYTGVSRAMWAADQPTSP